jgi:hypothetical protein
MKKWIKKAIRWALETYEEADSIDPWRGEHAINPTGIRLFDLAAIHLQDSGYYPRLYRSGNMMVVYKSRWKRLLDRRVGAVAFEIGRDTIWWNPIDPLSSENGNIWSWGFGKANSLHAGSSTLPCEKPHVICKVSDPFALDRILEAANEYYLYS